MSEKIPYAAFPKYGPNVVGQAKYDAELAAWTEYQQSLRNQHDGGQSEDTPEGPVDPNDSPDALESGPAKHDPIPSDRDPNEMDSYTYVSRYTNAGQTR